MSDLTEFSGASVKVIRAAFAVALSEREDISFADAESLADEFVTESGYLSLMDYSPMGYPMGDELIPLAEMYSDSSTDNEEADEITNLDIQVDDVKAHLHDKLLNISPDFSTRTSLTKDYPILNRVYEEYLRHSEFAGNLSADSEKFAEAEALLFPEDENGIPSPSKAYQRYVNYADRCFELELEISEANSSGKDSVVKLLQQKLQRLQAEWATIGRKREVEDALEVLSTSDAKAGYDDERNNFLELLESRLRHRLGSSEEYAAITISPLKPLLEPEDDGLWRKMVLTTGDVKRYLSTEHCALFGIDAEELSFVLKHFKSASMEYLRVFITREWLSKSFLRARYWDNPSVLSDGKGKGKLPTCISSVFFIKSAKLEIHRGIGVFENGRSSQETNSSNAVLLYNKVNTPLLKAVLENDAQDKSDHKKKRVIDARALTKLKSVSKLQSQETAKRLKVKTLRLSPKLLHQTFKPQERKLKSVKLQNHNVKLKSKLQIIKPIKALKLNPSLIINRKKSKKELKKLNFVGAIKHNDLITANDMALIVDLLDSNGNSVEEIQVPLTNNGSALKFRMSVTNRKKSGNRSQQPIVAASITLLDHDNEKLIYKKTSFTSRVQNVSLDWTVKTGTVDMALSSNVTPTLFAYGLELLPKSPNPDSEIFKG